MVKIKANHKVTQREILKYHICEHHKVGYEALEKLCEKQQKTLIKRDQVIERLSKNIEYNQNQLTEWRTNQKNWVSKISQELIDKANNHNQAMEEQKTHYEKELKELGDLYDKAVSIVCREKKASTSFIQRHLQIGYNRAARIIEKMESEGIVSPANHVGRREVLVGKDN